MSAGNLNGPTGSIGPTGSAGPTRSVPPEFSSIITNTQQLLVTTAENFNQALTLAQSIGPQASENSELKSVIHAQKQVLTELNRMEDTHNEEYLERTATPSPKSAMTVLGLRTTQDKAIAFFFLAFLLFSVSVVLFFIRLSTQKIVTAIYIISGLATLGGMTAVAIAYYG